jgi:hypothetical protein
VQESPRKRQKIHQEGGRRGGRGVASGPSVTACARGAVAVSKNQWKVQEKSKAPKISLKDNIHEIIGRLAAPNIFEDASANASTMLSALESELPGTTSESGGALNQCAQRLQKCKMIGFRGVFHTIISLIEVVRIKKEYVLDVFVHILCSSKIFSMINKDPNLTEAQIISSFDPIYNVTGREFRSWMKNGTSFGCLTAIGQSIHIFFLQVFDNYWKTGSIYLLILITTAKLKTKICDMPADVLLRLYDTLLYPDKGKAQSL